MVRMATTPETRSCVYCNGAGNVWSGTYSPRVQCLICKGSGRMTLDLKPIYPERFHAGVVVPVTTTGVY